MTRGEARCREILLDVVCQSCGLNDGTLDSYAITPYAEALRDLADLGYVRIESDVGRRVLARMLRGEGVT